MLEGCGAARCIPKGSFGVETRSVVDGPKGGILDWRSGAWEAEPGEGLDAGGITFELVADDELGGGICWGSATSCACSLGWASASRGCT